MNSSLEEVLDSCNVTAGRDGMVFFFNGDHSTNTDFLSAHLIAKCLDMERRLCYVSLHHSFTHTCAIMAKLGVNLKVYEKNDVIRVVEGQKLMTEAAGRLLQGGDISDHPYSFIFHGREKSLKNLYTLIRNSVTDWRSSKDIKYTIVIDNLTTFLSLGLLPTDVNAFVQYCCKLLRPTCNNPQTVSEESLCESRGSLIVTAASDCCDIDSILITNRLGSIADVTVSLESLRTGHCNDVDGNLTIDGRNDLPVTVQYKVSEKSVSVFAPGMASSVI